MRVYDKHGLADLLKCTPRTIERWEIEGRLPPATKIGRRRLWPAARIEQWLGKLRPERSKRKV